MNSSPFTLRTDDDLLATFRSSDQKSVVLPQYSAYPFRVENYYAWTDPSGVYTYLVFKRPDWETPLGLVFQRNSKGSASSPAGMCSWCHAMGPSDQIGLMTTTITSHMTGGTWLCLDLSCDEKLQQQPGITKSGIDKLTQKLCKRIGEFYQRARLDSSPAPAQNR